MPWRCRTTSASRRNRKTAENLSAVFSCRRAFYAFAGWVLTTAISRDTGAILREHLHHAAVLFVCQFQCAADLRLVVFEPHSTL